MSGCNGAAVGGGGDWIWGGGVDGVSRRGGDDDGIVSGANSAGAGDDDEYVDLDSDEYEYDDEYEYEHEHDYDNE
jgi:hypothetical protein